MAPAPLTTAALRGLTFEPDHDIWLLAVGKAANSMASAALTELDGAHRHVAGGLVVSTDVGSSMPPSIIALQGDHPVPSVASVRAATKLAEFAARVRGDDVVVVLISGGTSSLIGAPLPHLDLGELGALHVALLRSGLGIHDTNLVRKRFSRWGAGRLAEALVPARVEVLIISDVIGDDPADVGSGPCSPDPSTAAEVRELLERTGLRRHLPWSLKRYLDDVEHGVRAETPKESDRVFGRVRMRVIGTNRLALEAAAARAREAGLETFIVETPLTGEAAAAGIAVAETLLDRARRGARGVVLWGGECTVTMTSTDEAPRQSSTRHGLTATGGRCQELALAAARALSVSGADAQRLSLLAAGTDGRDGPTEAAGAFADASLWGDILRANHDPARALVRHETNAALHAVDALLPRRSTGTNVMDVVIGLVA